MLVKVCLDYWNSKFLLRTSDCNFLNEVKASTIKLELLLKLFLFASILMHLKCYYVTARVVCYKIIFGGLDIFYIMILKGVYKSIYDWHF